MNSPNYKYTFWTRQALNIAVLLISDSLILLLGLYIGDLILHTIHGFPISNRYSLALIPVWWAGAIAARVVPAWGLGAVEEFRRIQLILLSVFAAAGITVFLSRGQIVPSRIVYLFAWFFSAVMIPLIRLPVKRLLLKTGQWGARVAVYGNAEQVAGVIQSFSDNPLLGYAPCSVFTDDPIDCGQVHGVPVRGKITEWGRDASIAVVPVRLAEDLSFSERFDRVFSGYRRVVLLPDIREDVFLWAYPRTLGTLIGLEITSNLLNPLARIFKRALDLFLILLTIPVWVPLFFGIALMILVVERRNPFFLQRRVGRKNKVFYPVKFRTMVGNAEEALEKALASNDLLRAEWERSGKLRCDPRVTSLGRFLRRSSLDELPQVINVLFGHMSLVGPRPLPDYHHQRLTEAARAPRSRVRPGITGLWQVSGRSDSGTAGMEKWDTFYVRNWSVWLDIIILARTFLAVIKGEGAY